MPPRRRAAPVISVQEGFLQTRFPHWHGLASYNFGGIERVPFDARLNALYRGD